MCVCACVWSEGKGLYEGREEGLCVESDVNEWNVM